MEERYLVFQVLTKGGFVQIGAESLLHEYRHLDLEGNHHFVLMKQTLEVA